MKPSANRCQHSPVAAWITVIARVINDLEPNTFCIEANENISERKAKTQQYAFVIIEFRNE